MLPLQEKSGLQLELLANDSRVGNDIWWLNLVVYKNFFKNKIRNEI